MSNPLYPRRDHIQVQDSQFQKNFCFSCTPIRNPRVFLQFPRGRPLSDLHSLVYRELREIYRNAT